MLRLFTISIFLAVLLSCEKSKLSEPENTPPVIDNIIIDSENPKINQVIKLTAIASDIDKQKIYFRWSVSRGALTNNNEGNPIYWSTPNTIGNAIITCMVYDGVDVVTKSVGVNVTDNSELLE